MKHTGDYELDRINMLEQECADLEEENKRLEEENKKLKDDIKKWEDRRMRKLAEIYNMPTKYLTTAITKNEWYSSWYDTVKRKMLHELWFDRLDVQDLLKENKNLKSDLANIQCEFWFECDECEFWKREIKKHKPCLIKEEYVFNLWDYDYMILTSTTPQLKIIKKNNKWDSTFTVR